MIICRCKGTKTVTNDFIITHMKINNSGICNQVLESTIINERITVVSDGTIEDLLSFIKYICTKNGHTIKGRNIT